MTTVCNTDLSVSIADSSVVKVKYVKCLGVTIDESLSWGPHVEYVKKTVSSNMGMLTRICNYVPQSSLQTPSADMFSKLNWLSFSERVEYRKTTIVFICVIRKTPMYMTNIFPPLTHIRETRQSTHMALTIPFAKSNSYATNVRVSGANTWNDCLHNYEPLLV